MKEPSSSAAPSDLQSWVRDLARSGELVAVECEVDADLEVPEIHRRVIAAGGPALLFRNVKGSPFPLATNLFGTKKRVLSAFGTRPLDLIRELARLPEELMPPTLGKLWGKRSLVAAAGRIGLKTVRSAPVTEVAQTPARLMSLPATKSWLRDGGRFFTLPLVYTQHPTSGVANLGIYRMQVFDDVSTGMHFQIGKGGGYHLTAAAQKNQTLPAVVHLGGPPALMLAALAPLPENVPEPLLASLLLGKRLRQTRHAASPLPLFADAEFAIMGSIDPKRKRAEGPFGDHYGYYSETHDYPVFDVQAMVHRRGAIFPATVVGKPRQEDFFLGDFVQELLSPLFPLAMPAVRDLWSYGETGYHSLAAAVVQERYHREAMASAFRILGEGQLSLTKFLLVVDESLELPDFRAVLSHVLERADFATDLFLFANLSMDSLDYAGPRINEGGKGILLGIGQPVRKLPTHFDRAAPTGVPKVLVFAPGCLVIEEPAHAQDAEFAERIVRNPAFVDWPLVVLTDDADRAARSTQNFLWTTFTRFDPGRDVHAANVRLERHHPAFTAPILIDARMRASYPEELFCDERTAETVDKRWGEYFPGGRVEMGDSDRGHLD